MSRNTVQVVWAHPRTDSLTATVASDVTQVLRRSGLTVEVSDLYRSGFDPVLREPDEPDWNNLDKHYTPEVMAISSREGGAAAVVFVFPVWWYSMPAILKGHIDRVWNHGIFYGGGRRTGLPIVRWIALAGDTQHQYEKRGYDTMMAHHLNVGIAGFCGVEDSRLELLYNTHLDKVDPAVHVTGLRDQARATASALVDRLTARTP